jgi:phage antirepressor YoqD-like protein
MNEIEIAQKTMTSREIADLVDSRHDSVKRAIERLAERGVISQPPTVDGPKSPNGVIEKHYLIGKRDSYIIVAQLSPQFTARLVDRWQELEAKVPALPDFSDPAAAARAWAAEYEAKRALQIESARQAEQLAIAAPKVEYADALMNADGTMLVRDVAKTIGVPVRKLQAALKDKGVILGNNAPAAEFVTKGYFREAIHPIKTKSQGTLIRYTAMVTGRGIEFVRRFAKRHLIPA